ncbi:MAG: hypothetical protein DLM69_11810 [Candidatus Chloroheliales bacterium]|nr:MAG: hypothetical protein DLM69_11810 [Chloroflexota bacterium]
MIAPLPSIAQREIAAYFAQYGPPVRVVFGGDIMLGRSVDAMMQQYGDDYPFAAISDTISGADLAVANLESPLTDQPTPVRPDGQWINLKGRPAAAKAIARAGFDIITVANNHALDYGSAGLSDTVAALHAAGLRHIGTSDQPAFVTIKGLRLAFLGYDCVATSQLPAGTPLAAIICSGPQLEATKAALKAEIGQARAQADAVIVFMHWGLEYDAAPSDFQRNLAQSIAAAGATIIVGCHPHVTQGLARVGNALVAYSLGNFIFDQRTPIAAQTGALLDVTLDRSGVASATFRPLSTFLQTRMLADSDPHALAAIANAASSSDAALLWQAVSPLPPRSFGVAPESAPAPAATLALAYRREQQPTGVSADLNGDGRDEWVSYRSADNAANPIGSLNVAEQSRAGPFEWWHDNTAMAATTVDGQAVAAANWQPGFASEPQMQVRQVAIIRHYGGLPAVIFNFWQPDYRWGGQGQLKNQLCVYGWLMLKRQWGQLWCGRPLPTTAQNISVVEASDGSTRLGVLWGDDPTQATMTIWSAPGFGFVMDWQSVGRGYTHLFADDAGHRFLYKL